MRNALRSRTTKETAIDVTLNLHRTEVSAGDEATIDTGVRMLDHLLQQFAFHSRCSLTISARSFDGLQHHLVEDVAIAFGQALNDALGERRGIERFSEVTIPMDEALVRVAIDLSGRPYARANLPLAVEKIEDLSSVLVSHFFCSFANAARLTLHIDQLAGSDPHHCVEAAFKALARACREAWAPAWDALEIIPSTKSVL